MNFYKHHIGDYAQATGHLSFVEDAAYSRLIRKYYADERPLPTDLKSVQRLVGARSREEKEAVQTVLEEFFSLDADGWHNKRCDAEIAKASAQADTNRRIAEEREARRRERTHHDTLHESCTTPVHESSRVREPSQTPDTRHQTPDSRKDTHQPAVAASPGVCPSELSEEQEKMLSAVVEALRKAGIRGVSTKHPRLRVHVAKGATAEQYGAAARDAVSKGKGFPYVVGTVRNQLAEADGDARELPAAAPHDGDWQNAPQSVVEKRGVEVGVGKWDPVKEQWEQYKRRVSGADKERASA